MNKLFKVLANYITFSVMFASLLIMVGCGHGNSGIKPSVIVDQNSYKPEWDYFVGHKCVDTTGAESLVLDKEGNLWYFGTESHKPVIIMRDVKLFEMDDDSDTLGITSPVAVILTNNGDLYACGDTVYDTIRDVAPQGNIPEDRISFLKPVLINGNVVNCNVDWREIDYYTGDYELYRSTNNYTMFDVEIDNPTKVTDADELSKYFKTEQNCNYVLSDTVQMGSGRYFHISVLTDGSVWTCYLPDSDESRKYAVGYGEVMGDGRDELIEAEPVCIFPAGTCSVQTGTDIGNKARSDADCVEVVRDDRSFAWVDENDQIFDEASFYYEEALLSDSVANADKINNIIHEKKKAYFEEHADPGIYNSRNYEIRMLTEPADEDCETFLHASVRSIYLDDNFYSVNLEGNYCYGGPEHSEFIGYTFDLNTGEEVALPELLNMSEEETRDLVYEKINNDYNISGFDSFPARDDFYIDNFCICQNGKIYVYYNRNSIGAGYRGSVGYYIKKLDEIGDIRYQYMSELGGGRMDTLPIAEIDKVKSRLHIPEDIKLYVYQDVPYCEGDSWFVPLKLSENDSGENVAIPVASADVNADTGEPEFNVCSYRDTSEYMKYVSGGWWATNFYPSCETYEMPDYIDFDNRWIKVYDYDADNEYYLLNASYLIHDIGLTENGYYIETEKDRGKITYEIDMDAPGQLSAYLCWKDEVSGEDFLKSYAGTDSLNRAGFYDDGTSVFNLPEIERRSSRDVEIAPTEYLRTGIDDDHFADFDGMDDFTNDEEELIRQYLNLPDSEYDNAPVYENSSTTPYTDAPGLVKFADYEDEGVRVFGTTGMDLWVFIVEYKGKRQGFPIWWGSGYSQPKIMLEDMDGDGDKELMIASVELRGTGLFREILNVFEPGDEIERVLLDRVSLANMLKDYISLDFNRQSVVLKDDNAVLDEIRFREYEYDEVLGLKPDGADGGKITYSIDSLNFVDNWEFDFDTYGIRLHVAPGIKVNDTRYIYSLADKWKFEFLVEYTGDGFKVRPI